jgi:hypothetical protein
MADSDAIIPFKREKKYIDFEPTYMTVYKTNPNDPDDKEKYHVRQYGGSDQEDHESFLDAFDEFKDTMEMKGYWDNTVHHNTPVPILFDKTLLMLKDTAKADWHDALDECSPHGTTWNDWKRIVPYYILHKVLPPNAYKKQVRYMEQQNMPQDMTFKDYTKWLAHANHLLKYMLDQELVEEVSDGAYKAIKHVWEHGSLNKSRLKNIYMTRCPR